MPPRRAGAVSPNRRDFLPFGLNAAGRRGLPDSLKTP